MEEQEYWDSVEKLISFDRSCQRKANNIIDLVRELNLLVDAHPEVEHILFPKYNNNMDLEVKKQNLQ